MRYTFVSLVLIYLTGCSTLHISQNQDFQKGYDKSKLQKLETFLTHTPINVQDLKLSKSKKNSNQQEISMLILASNIIKPDTKFIELSAILSTNTTEPIQQFAETLSGYLTDPDFQCKEPLYFDYFHNRYPLQSPKILCKKKVPFAVADEKKGVQIVWIDPKQVSEIHLLFAGNGEYIASRFGHVALRLIVCPDSNSNKLECSSNLYEHLILGYMAHIDEFELNTLKGLTGEYETNLFAFSFMDMYRDYTINEFRDISSIPLHLTQEEKEKFVRGLAEIHWSYSGNYHFFFNNCATLLQDTLKIILPKYTTYEHLQNGYIRPDSFFSAISDTNLTDKDKLISKIKAEEDGYFFPSTLKYYSQALAFTNKYHLKKTYQSVDAYLQESPNNRRKNIFSDKEYIKYMQANPHILEAQLILEELSYLRLQRRMLATLSRYFIDNNIELKKDALHPHLNKEENNLLNMCLLNPIRQMTQSFPRFKGIPKQETLPEFMYKKPICQTVKTKSRLRKILMTLGNNQKSWQNVLQNVKDLDSVIRNITILEEL